MTELDSAENTLRWLLTRYRDEQDEQFRLRLESMLLLAGQFREDGDVRHIGMMLTIAKDEACGARLKGQRRWMTDVVAWAAMLLRAEQWRAGIVPAPNREGKSNVS